jgi:serine/threonine-protein kinase RsbW
MTDPVDTRSFPAQSSSLRDIRRWIEDAGRLSLDPGELNDLKLAVTEACANAVRHSGSTSFVVSVDRSDGCIEVTVHDEGVFREALAPFDGDDAHRGLSLIAQVVDEFSVRPGTRESKGTTVRMRKCPA